MCLSTIYKNEKRDDNILCRFVATIQAEGDKLTFVDVMGASGPSPAPPPGPPPPPPPQQLAPPP